MISPKATRPPRTNVPASSQKITPEGFIVRPPATPDAPADRSRSAGSRSRRHPAATPPGRPAHPAARSARPRCLPVAQPVEQHTALELHPHPDVPALAVGTLARPGPPQVVSGAQRVDPALAGAGVRVVVQARPLPQVG